MYYCGWDGGGTKTGVCIMNEDGTVRAEAAFGLLNPNGASREKVLQTVGEAIEYMKKQPGGLAACGGLVIGAAGINNAHTAALLSEAVADCGYTGKLRLLGDQEIALAGAVEGPGVVLIAGTGSVCFGKDAQGRSFRAGGYGYLIDDGGSGYAIGRDILVAVVRASDGRGPETCLTETVYGRLGVDKLNQMITWVYGPETGKKEIASLAPLLLPALELQDEAAQGIARKAAEDLCALAVALWKKSGMQGGELALLGSIFRYFAPIRRLVEEKLHTLLPQVAVIEPRGSAALGAAKLAREI